jgi:hypothetical protein
VSLPVTVSVRVPEAVPLALDVPMVVYSPELLVKVIVVPIERFVWLGC